MNKKEINVNANIIYAVGVLSYGVIVANMYTKIPVLQAINGFAVVIAKFIAVGTVPFIILSLVSLVSMSKLVDVFKVIDTGTIARYALDKHAKDKDKWDNLKDLKSKRVTLPSVLFWVLFILTVVGGGTFTAIMMLFMVVIARGLKVVGIKAYDEYLRLVKLAEEVEEEK